jgi:hypothetical protein
VWFLQLSASSACVSVSYSSRTRFASALFLNSLLRRTSPNFSIRRLGRVHPVPQPFTPTTYLLFKLLIFLLEQTLLLLQGLLRYFLIGCFAAIVQGVAYPLRSTSDLFRVATRIWSQRIGLSEQGILTRYFDMTECLEEVARGQGPNSLLPIHHRSWLCFIIFVNEAADSAGSS